MGVTPEPSQYKCLNRTSVGLKPQGRADGNILVDGLNRTSVGLKLIPPDFGGVVLGPPQSNQRGIETWFGWSHEDAIKNGLNRTSVGLKL